MNTSCPRLVAQVESLFPISEAYDVTFICEPSRAGYKPGFVDILAGNN